MFANAPAESPLVVMLSGFIIYDPNDPQAVAAFWAAATVRRGRGRPPVAVPRPTLNMRVDADVLAAFKATGPGWQTRINAVLRQAVQGGLSRSDRGS
jgi:uncharacterized protein (DUF4415 family)